MEEKKTTKTPTKDPQNSWTAFLLDNIFQSIQSFVDGAVESVHQATRALTPKVGGGALLFSLSVFLASYSFWSDWLGPWGQPFNSPVPGKRMAGFLFFSLPPAFGEGR